MKPPFTVDKRCRDLVLSAITTIRNSTGGTKWSYVLDFCIRASLKGSDDQAQYDYYRELFDAVLHLMCINKEIETIHMTGLLRITGLNPVYNIDDNIREQWARKMMEQSARIKELERSLASAEKCLRIEQDYVDSFEAP